MPVEDFANYQDPRKAAIAQCELTGRFYDATMLHEAEGSATVRRHISGGAVADFSTFVASCDFAFGAVVSLV